MIRSRSHAGLLLSLFAAAALTLIIGCGGDEGDAEAQLAAASQELAAAHQDVDQAREVVGERQSAVQSAREQHDEAVAELREAERRLAEVEQRVDLTATDAALFRTIQKRLLEDDSLDSVAIAARVDKGAVFLSGSVPDAELRELALEIARATPGVTSVQSQISVAAPAVSAE
jgi:osmotically-inducible protein OsmY